MYLLTEAWLANKQGVSTDVDMTVLGGDGLGYGNSNGHTLTEDKGCDSTLTYNEANVQNSLVDSGSRSGYIKVTLMQQQHNVPHNDNL